MPTGSSVSPENSGSTAPSTAGQTAPNQIGAGCPPAAGSLPRRAHSASLVKRVAACGGPLRTKAGNAAARQTRSAFSTHSVSAGAVSMLVLFLCRGVTSVSLYPLELKV
ncbi:hypothetical protein ACW7BJ_27125 [Azospirillum argentinense]